MLDLEQVILIGLFVKGELLLVFGCVVLGLLQLEGKPAGGVAVARVQVGLDLGFQQRDVLAAIVHLPGHALDHARYCASPSRPSLICSTERSYSYCISAIGS